MVNNNNNKNTEGAKMNFLTIVNDKVVVEIESNNAFTPGERIVIESIEELETGGPNGIFFKSALYKSSSIDFPEESTENAETIALAKAITDRV